MKIFSVLFTIIYSPAFTGNILAQPSEKVNSNFSLLPGSLQRNSLLPQLGAEVWLEPQYSGSYIESLFKLMADNHMQAARIFIGSGNSEMYDNVFASAEKYG